MKDETKPEQKSSFAKRFLALENQVAELREYLHLPPATETDEPDRSILFVIADISEREDDDQGRDDNAECRDGRPGNAGYAGSDEGRGVDGNRSRRHFRNRHEVHKFAHREPPVLYHDLFLD